MLKQVQEGKIVAKLEELAPLRIARAIILINLSQTTAHLVSHLDLFREV